MQAHRKSVDDEEEVPHWQEAPTYLDKGEPENVVGDAVKPQRLEVLPVTAVAGHQELGHNESSKGDSCPPGHNNGEHSCPYSHLQQAAAASQVTVAMGKACLSGRLCDGHSLPIRPVSTPLQQTSKLQACSSKTAAQTDVWRVSSRLAANQEMGLCMTLQELGHAGRSEHKNADSSEVVQRQLTDMRVWST